MPTLYLLFCVLGFLPQSVYAEDNPIVYIQTNYGTISVELAPEKAPVTVQNFLTYVNEGFYEDTLFHRVIAGFMIQGGGFTKAMQQKPTHVPIKLESNNRLKNSRGTIAMARTSVADSATAQFFINSADNGFLNYQNTNNPGYAVFGKVIEGLEVVDLISKVSTSTAPATKDVPLQPVIIEAARVREAQLNFKDLKPIYSAGDTLTIALQETTLKRKRALDLWVAVRLPGGELRFISPENTDSFSVHAKPFKRKVSVSEAQHAITSLLVPAGLAGQFAVFAIFNEPEHELNDLKHSLRSNLASALLEIR
ncbi:MAG: peptidylprolyl isomerase [Methylococcales bacterium]